MNVSVAPPAPALPPVVEIVAIDVVADPIVVLFTVVFAMPKCHIGLVMR